MGDYQNASGGRSAIEYDGNLQYLEDACGVLGHYLLLVPSVI
jgi:hypothetical protein